MLYRLVESVTEILGVDGCGVSVVVNTEGQLRPSDRHQRADPPARGHRGSPAARPYVDAFHDGEVVDVHRLPDQAATWPDWCAKAAELSVEAGSPLAGPRAVARRQDIYSRDAREWRDPKIRVPRVLCDMAASYVLNASTCWPRCPRPTPR